jgi:hypothetical protein
LHWFSNFFRLLLYFFLLLLWLFGVFKLLCDLLALIFNCCLSWLFLYYLSLFAGFCRFFFLFLDFLCLLFLGFLGLLLLGFLCLLLLLYNCLGGLLRLGRLALVLFLFVPLLVSIRPNGIWIELFVTGSMKILKLDYLLFDVWLFLLL